MKLAFYLLLAIFLAFLAPGLPFFYTHIRRYRRLSSEAALNGTARVFKKTQRSYAKGTGYEIECEFNDWRGERQEYSFFADAADGEKYREGAEIAIKYLRNDLSEVCSTADLEKGRKLLQSLAVALAAFILFIAAELGSL